MGISIESTVKFTKWLGCKNTTLIGVTRRMTRAYLSFKQQFNGTSYTTCMFHWGHVVAFMITNTHEKVHINSVKLHAPLVLSKENVYTLIRCVYKTLALALCSKYRYIFICC